MSKTPVDSTLEKKFRQFFFELLESMEGDPEIQECDFRGFCFPLIDFTERTFPKTVSFEGSTFEAEVNFLNSIFKAKAFFGHSTFKAGAYFRNSIFEAEANFRNSIFKAKADFRYSTFKAEAKFRGSIFEAKADFGYSIFKAGAHFWGSTFEAGANFWDSTFEAKADFGYSTFKAEADFGDSTFEAEADFGDSTFKAKANFERSKFLNECYFIALRLEKDAQIIFEKANLTKASFLNTNLESINFRDVYWHVPKKKLIPRKEALWDEFRPLKDSEKGPRDYEKIAENYRQLVLNYERKRDYETAEQFHVGEMETRRKKKAVRINLVWLRKLRELFNAYGLYRYLNNYGTSYWLGFGVLVFLLLFFSGIFLLTGFKPGKEISGVEPRLIEYNLWPDSKHQPVSIRQWLPDYGKAILLTLSIITFQREKFYQPVGAWSQFWLLIAVIVLTSQAALVLLAIRRQFRR